MIYGRNKILQWYENIPDCPYISIYRKGKVETGNFVFSNKDTPNQTKDDGRLYLEKCLAIIGSGDFEIIAHTKDANTQKGRYEESFSISASEATANNPQQQQPAVAGIPEGYVSKAEATQIAEDKFRQMMNEKENEELRKKFAELQKENKELTANAKKPWNDMIGTLAPYLPEVLKGFGLIPAIAPAVHGVDPNGALTDNNIKDIPHTEVEETTDVNEVNGKIIESFVKALAAQYPEQWPVILQKLTNTVINEPAKIDMALKFI